jgi:hypothetical protein
LSNLTKDQEQYIEHEVKIRTHDVLFKHLEEKFNKLDNKFNWIIALIISGIVIPIVLHKYNLI